MNSATCLGVYFVRMNGPPETIGALLLNLVSALPLPVAYLAQMCWGRIGTCWTCDSTLATGWE